MAADVDSKRVYAGARQEHGGIGPYPQRLPQPPLHLRQPHPQHAIPPALNHPHLPNPTLMHPEQRGLSDAASHAHPPPRRAGFTTPLEQRRSHHEGLYSRTPSTTGVSQPTSAVDALTQPLIDNHDSHPAPMEVDHYPTYPGHDGRPNGLSYSQHHDGHVVTSYGPPHLVSAPSYEQSFPYPVGYDGMPSNQQARRKAVRATQACDNCRTKKAKCDEERPSCSACQSSGTTCNYRDVPPPKQERTIMQLTDQVSSVDERLGRLESTLHVFKQEMLNTFREELRSVTRGNLLVDRTVSQVERQDCVAEPGIDVHQHSIKQSLSNTKLLRHHVPGSAQQIMEQSHSMSRVNSSTREYMHSSDFSLAGSVHADNDTLKGELSIPAEHTTAAHKLLTLWKSIAPFYQNITDADYVMRGEKGRGLLRLHGRGQGNDGMNRYGQYPSALSLPPHLEREDSSSASSPVDGYWGTGTTPPAFEYTRAPLYTAGGLGPDGLLSLDEGTCQRLLDSFLRNVYVMHPFLNRARIIKAMHRFGSRYKPEMVASQSPGFVTDSLTVSDSPPEVGGGFKPPKRKRTHGTTSDLPNGSVQPPGKATRRVEQPIEHSVDSALMLLILALGKICEHRGPMPALADDTDGLVGSSNLVDHIQVLPASFKSPSAVNLSRSASLPNTETDRMAFAAGGRVSSNGYERREAVVKNADKIPGLAYYTKAAGILGELHGGDGLPFIQAFILAGLYMGQLVRVYESWKWIYWAGLNCRILINAQNETRMFDMTQWPDQYIDSIRMAYWTCHQLECDIIAELDLPQTGISTLEDRMPLPKGPTVDLECNNDDQIMMLYYTAQIHVRKLLNRAHSALYVAGHQKLKHAGWSVMNGDELAKSLEEWREKLPPQLAWDDNEPPAREINAARLRGKYYGALYMIHRPFLMHVMVATEKPGAKAPDSPMIDHDPNSIPHDEQWWHEKIETNVSFVKRSLICRNAAHRSTLAFDGVRWALPGDDPRDERRLIVTNIFGTAHAQFSNMLVLAATHTNDWLSWLVPDDLMTPLLDRTIAFLSDLAPLSPTMATNVKILENTKRIAAAKRMRQRKARRGNAGEAPLSASAGSSFGM